MGGLPDQPGSTPGNTSTNVTTLQGESPSHGMTMSISRAHERACRAAFCSSLAALLVLSACSDDDPVEDPTDTRADTAQDTGGGDTSDATDQDTADQDVERPAPGTPVVVDLSTHADLEGGDGASAFQVDDADQLIPGATAEGQIGDYMLENDQVRFVIEGDTRMISPCPYGGNVIDLSTQTPGAEDSLGEICIMVQMGQTMDPDAFAVLADGSDGGAAVLAVTGHIELLDWINVLGMIDGFIPGLVTTLSVDTENVAPYTITVYYVLHPDAHHLDVITAIRHDGDEPLTTPFLHLIDSSGPVELFNPLSSKGGWGFNPLGATSIAAEILPFVAFWGQQTSFAYLPSEPDLGGRDLPVHGSYLAISGLVWALWGSDDVIPVLTATPRSLPTLDGMITLEGGDVVARHHRLFVGDGQVADVVDAVYAAEAVETGILEGTLLDGTSQPVAGARITAIADDRAFNQAVSADDGTYAMAVPPGDYDVTARLPGRVTPNPGDVTVTAGETSQADLVLSSSGTLSVTLSDAADQPLMGRVTVLCAGECASVPTSRERDMSFDPYPEGVAAVAYVGTDGTLDLPLGPGSYEVVVSRGMEWSTWPADAVENGGTAVTIAAGESSAIDAEIARVIDTDGAMGADFHIHAINSMDSPVSVDDRILGHLADGVEVLVSTDHDVITDFAPYIDALGVADQVVSLVGQEITTDTYGHYNAFPLERDPESRNGGAFDWANGPELNLPPADMFAWADEHPGTQVIQVNHGDRLGMMTGLDANVRTGVTSVDPALVRLPADHVDEETGDTGLWSDGFTAMEITNGKSNSGRWGRFQWWLSMIGRGFAPTGTAVTDNHSRFQLLGSVPRSYVWAGEDDIAEFDGEAFAQAINDGRLLGTTGPFVTVSVENASAETAGLGEVLATNGEAVTATLDIQLATWMTIDTVDVYMNITRLSAEARSTSNRRPEATQSVPIAWSESTLVDVAEGDVVHQRREMTVEVELETDADAYLVFVVYDSTANDMFPVVDSELTATAFTNPVFLDADGGGYDKPPYALEDDERTPEERPVGLVRDEEPRYLTRELIEVILRDIESLH